MTGLSTLPSTRDQARHGLLLLGVPATPTFLVEVHRSLFDGDLSIPSLAALIREEERSLTAALADQPPAPAAPLDAAALAAPLDPAALAAPLDAAALAAPLDAAALAAPVDLAALAASPDPAALVRPDPAAPVHPDRAAHAAAVTVCPGLNLDLTPARGAVTLAVWPLSERICTPATTRADTLTAVIRVIEFAAARPGAVPARLLRHLSTLVPGGPETVDVLNPAALAEAAHLALVAPALVRAVEAESATRAEAAERATHLPERHQLFGIPTVPHQRGSA